MAQSQNYLQDKQREFEKTLTLVMYKDQEPVYRFKTLSWPCLTQQMIDEELWMYFQWRGLETPFINHETQEKKTHFNIIVRDLRIRVDQYYKIIGAYYTKEHMDEQINHCLETCDNTEDFDIQFQAMVKLYNYITMAKQMKRIKFKEASLKRSAWMKMMKLMNIRLYNQAVRHAILSLTATMQ